MNYFVGADLLGFLEFLIASGSGDDVRAEEFGNLDCCAADTASRGKHKHALAGLQLCTPDKHVPRRLENKRNCSCVHPIENSWVRHAVHFGTANIFGATTVDHVAEIGEVTAKVVVTRNTSGTFSASDPGRQDHLLTDVNGGDFVAELGHFSRDITAGYMGKRYGDARDAAANPQVKMVQRASMDADEDFARVEMRFGNIGIVKNAWIAVLMKDDSFHGRPLWTGTLRVPTAVRYIVSRYVGGA